MEVEISLKTRKRLASPHPALGNLRRQNTAWRQLLTVIRRSGSWRQDVAARSKVLYVESAPCGLRSEFAFDAEEQIMRLGFDKKLEVEKDPTRATLKERIAKLEPDVIHFAGFDSHQAARLLPDLPRTDLDGYLLHLDNGNADLVTAKELAEIVCSAKTKPTLVSFNIYNSAARLAGLCVAEGCAAAIGYQDDFNDRLSEVFYERLYWAWQKDAEDLLAAFRCVFGSSPAGCESVGFRRRAVGRHQLADDADRADDGGDHPEILQNRQKDCEQVLKPPGRGRHKW